MNIRMDVLQGSDCYQFWQSEYLAGGDKYPSFIEYLRETLPTTCSFAMGKDGSIMLFHNTEHDWVEFKLKHPPIV